MAIPADRPAYLEDPFGISSAAADQHQLAPSTGMGDPAGSDAMFLDPSARHHTVSGPVASSSDYARTAGRHSRIRRQR